MTTTRAEKYERAMAVELSDRQEYHGFILYTALSSTGQSTYTVWLRDGVAVGCSCPSTCGECKHRLAAEMAEGFLVAWNAPVAQASGNADDIMEVQPVTVEEMILGYEFAQDVPAHVEDSLRSGELAVGTCAKCSNPVKPGFVLCAWCSGAAAA